MQVSQGLNNLANSKPKTSIREDESELLQQNCAILKTNEKSPPNAKCILGEEIL
jgi:hypothetical protein